MEKPVEMKSKCDYSLHEQLKDVSDICPVEEIDTKESIFILYKSHSTGKPNELYISHPAI